MTLKPGYLVSYFSGIGWHLAEVRTVESHIITAYPHGARPGPCPWFMLAMSELRPPF